mgnify:CR=1 FL=1
MHITVCGAGTLGAHIVEHLCRQGGDQVRVIDFDRVESVNLVNQPYLRHQVGLPKTRALEEVVIRSTGRGIESVQKRLSTENAARLLAGSDLVIDAFDNGEARNAVRGACLHAGQPCLHAGLHPSGYAEVVWTERYTVPRADGEDACALRQARALSLLVVAVCARAIEVWRENGERLSFSVTARDLRVEPF